MRQKCWGHLGTLWVNIRNLLYTHTLFLYRKGKGIVYGCIWTYMGQYVQVHQMVQILIHFVGRYPNDMAQFGGLAWGQQYLQQILPRRVEEVSVSAKTGKRWALVTMSKKCWQATAMNLAFWGWLIQSINMVTWWWFIWDGSLVHIGTILMTTWHSFFTSKLMPPDAPGSQVTYPPRGEGLVAQAAGTPQAGRLFVMRSSAGWENFSGAIGGWTYSNSNLEATRRQ